LPYSALSHRKASHQVDKNRGDERSVEFRKRGGGGKTGVRARKEIHEAWGGGKLKNVEPSRTAGGGDNETRETRVCGPALEKVIEPSTK